MIYLVSVIPLYIAMIFSIVVVIWSLYAVFNLILRVLAVKIGVLNNAQIYPSILLAASVYWFLFDTPSVKGNAATGWSLVGIEFKTLLVAWVVCVSFTGINALYGKYIVRPLKN